MTRPRLVAFSGGGPEAGGEPASGLAALREVCERAGYELAEQTPSAEEVDRALRQGQAVGFAGARGGWALLALPLSDVPDPGDVGFAAAMQTFRTYDRGRLSRRVSQSHARRRATGLRSGRRPRRLPQEIAVRLEELRYQTVADGHPPRGYTDIATRLNDTGMRPPGANGALAEWTGNSVRRALEILRRERVMFLRRLAGLIEDLQAQANTDVEVGFQAFVAACRQHAIDRFWVLDQFDGDHAEHLDTQFAPPFRRVGDRIQLTPKAHNVVELRRDAERPSGELDALWCLWRWHEATPAQMDRLCRSFGVSVETLVGQDLVTFDRATARYRLSPRGEELAGAWEQLTNPDPNGRWDIGYLPDDTLASGPWDWNDPPRTATPADSAPQA